LRNTQARKQKRLIEQKGQTMTKKRKIGKKQLEFIEHYRNKALNVFATCQAMNMNRGTFYVWLDEVEGFQELVNEAKESFKDWVESQIVSCMQEKDRTMLIFYAKTKMKDRGYIERQEIQHSGNTQNTNKLEIEIIRSNENAEE